MSVRLFCAGFFMMVIGSLTAQTAADGLKLYGYEKYNSAVSVYKQLTAANPQDLTSWYWLVKSEVAAGNAAEAIAAAHRVPAGLQDQPIYQVIQGIAALEARDSAAARNAFTAAIGTARKKDPLIQLAVAQANIDADKGDLNYALSLLDEAERKEDKNPALFLARGDAYRKLYNGSESFRNYQRAAELDSKNPVAYYKLGKIYQTQNNVPVFTEYYNKAIAADPLFPPVYFQLYYYQYFKDVKKALPYLQEYIKLADADQKNTYLLADLYYINRDYQQSIAETNKIMSNQPDSLRPRLYKLLAYNYDGLKDSVNAASNLKKYFETGHDSTKGPDDFELMAKLLSQAKNDSLAMEWHEKAFVMETDSTKKALIARKVIDIARAGKQYGVQAAWYGRLDSMKATMSNVDIFNWGVANYNAQNYLMADSVFGIYQTRYPDQTFGYYWRARANAAIDTAMEKGLAIPHYENLIAVASKDTTNANNRKWLIQAYGYLAAYAVNQEKKYTEALGYYDKILDLDPDNNDAEKYKSILTKMIDSQASTAKDKDKDKDDDTEKNKDKSKEQPQHN
jgi:tetratricopeptide (TPR) repeat protein